MTRNKIALLAASVLLLAMAGCGAFSGGAGNSGDPQAQRSSKDKTVLTIGAIPDQDPEKLQRLYSKLASYLSQELEKEVVYKPVTDYTAAVTAFKVGDLDLVWFGGLTGVQARLQVDGAEAIAQRAVDENFRSVFIVNKKTNIAPFTNLADLDKLKNLTFTFGSETSTSGRLMPQYFLDQAGVKLEDFKGQPGFSKNHDATIKLVEAGTYDAGVLNQKVWDQRVQEGSVDTDKVYLAYQTPPYYDYHWVIHPSVKERFGQDFVTKVQKALLNLQSNKADHAEILNMFSANKFIKTKNENYRDIEKIGREIGKITTPEKASQSDE